MIQSVLGIVVLQNKISGETYFGLELECGHSVRWDEGNSDTPPNDPPEQYQCQQCGRRHHD